MMAPMGSWKLIRAAGLAAAMLATACISRSSAPEPERSERFEGVWIVEQPYHAGYEATVYQLHASGTVETGPTYTVSDLAPDYVTGTVTDPRAGVRCVLAGQWYSVDDATLVIDGDCSDGRFREIVLGFGANPASNAIDAEVVVVSVGGEDGWTHDDWRWRWRQCGVDSALECNPL